MNGTNLVENVLRVGHVQTRKPVQECGICNRCGMRDGTLP